MDGPTLITQPPGYPEERPETDDMDGMLDHLADELEGKQVLEKPRVSKKVTCGCDAHICPLYAGGAQEVLLSHVSEEHDGTQQGIKRIGGAWKVGVTRYPARR